MIRTILVFTILFFLAACGGINVPLALITPVVSPSSIPAILSPTPPFIPSSTPTPTVHPSFITLTEVPSTTPTTPTATITPAVRLFLEISGCNTSLDVTHGMGEVTNAYPVIYNYTGAELTNVCATLSATDEGRLHPDKTACAPSLPTGYRIMLKLTVDTGYEQDTAIQVEANSSEGFAASQQVASCRELGFPGWIPSKVGILEPIP
jgi:hypothetical protein